MADPLPYPLYGGDTVDPDIIDFDDIEIPLRDKTEAGNAQHKKVIGADLKASFLGTIPEDVAELKTPVQKVVLVRPDGTRIWFKATDSSEAAGEIALRNALSQWTTGSKVIIRGGFCSVTGQPLKNSLPPGTVSVPTGIVFFEDLNCGVRYNPPDLAREDGNFILFGPRLHILNFGAHQDAADNADAFDSIRLALPEYSATGGEFEDGERRYGIIDVSMGEFRTSREFRIWGNCSFGEAIKTGQFALYFNANYAPADGPERFGVVLERLKRDAPGDPGASNFTHYVNIEHLNIRCAPVGNENFKPIRFGAAQTSKLDSISIGRCKRGLYILNDSNNTRVDNLWVNGPLTHGPGLDVFGSRGMSFGSISVEHQDRAEEFGRVVPAIRFNYNWGVNFNTIQFENIRAGIECVSSRGCHLGAITMFDQPPPNDSADYVVRLINCDGVSTGGISAIHAKTGLLDQTADVNPDGTLSNVVTRAVLTEDGIEHSRKFLGPYFQKLFVNKLTVTGNGPGYSSFAFIRTDADGSTYADTWQITSAGNGNTRYFTIGCSGSGGSIPTITFNNGSRGFPNERVGRGSLGFMHNGQWDLYFGSSSYFRYGIRAQPIGTPLAVEDFEGEHYHARLIRSGNQLNWYYSTGSDVRMVGPIQLDAAARPYMAALPSYADDSAADADTTLPSGALYKVGREVRQKP